MTTKNELIMLINGKFDGHLNSTNTSFASINKRNKIWWFNIGINKFNNAVNLLLDHQEYVTWVFLSKGFVKQLSETFRIRTDKNAVDLEICAERDERYLKDIKSGGTEFDFNPFVKQIVQK